MKKKYLFLGLSLLLCGGSAWAQTTSKDIASFEALTEAINGINNAANLKTEIAQLEQDVKTYENNLKAATQYVTVNEKVSHVHNAINSYVSTVVSKNNPENTTEISYALGTDTQTEWDPETFEDITTTVHTLYISIPTVSSGVSSETNTTKGITEWKTVQAANVYRIKNSGTTEEKKSLAFYYESKVAYPTQLVFVFRKKNTGEIMFANPVVISGVNKPSSIFHDALLNFCFANSSTLFTVNNDYSATEEVIQTDADGKPIETLDYQNKKKILDEATSLLNNKKAELGDFALITTLNITNDITVTTPNALATQTWPAGYTIEGNYHTVKGTDTGNNPLFNANNGSIYNWVAVDGRIAKTNSGTVDNCIVKTVDGYRVYTENAYTNAGADIKDAVYQKREAFGYNLAEQKVGEVSESNKLYKASYASATKKAKQSFYVNINESNITDGNGLTSYSTENAFIYVEDEVPATTTIETENVVANGVCQKAKIVEGSTKAEFYIPTDFTAANLNYERDLKTDVASVCLPFALTEEVKATINEKLKQDGSNNEMYYYNYRRLNKETRTVWFGRLTEIDANKPGVLAFTTGCKPGMIFNGLTNVNFVSTEGADLALTATDDVDDQAKRFRGNYKPKQTTDDVTLAAGNMGSYAYSFKDGGLVKLNEKALINQFRSFIIYSSDLTKENQEANLRVRFMDEEGNEVTHIENVSTDRNENSGFKVSGSNGAIEISTDKACDVKVYTTGGALVKAVRVEAGQTSLPVNAGMYIVNKNKVVVK